MNWMWLAVVQDAEAHAAYAAAPAWWLDGMPAVCSRRGLQRFVPRCLRSRSTPESSTATAPGQRSHWPSRRQVCGCCLTTPRCNRPAGTSSRVVHPEHCPRSFAVTASSPAPSRSVPQATIRLHGSFPRDGSGSGLGCSDGSPHTPAPTSNVTAAAPRGRTRCSTRPMRADSPCPERAGCPERLTSVGAQGSRLG